MRQLKYQDQWWRQTKVWIKTNQYTQNTIPTYEVPEQHVQQGHDTVGVCLAPPLDWEVVNVSDNLRYKSLCVSRIFNVEHILVPDSEEEQHS